MTNETPKITVEKIAPVAFGGGGYGNIFHYIVSRESVSILVASEREVAYYFQMYGLPIPKEFKGPYDGYGRNEANQE